MRDKILLIDAYSIICRGFYALPLLSNSKGQHTNAVLGFLNILYKNIEEEKPKYIAVAFDENKKTFRHKLYKDYKGQRSSMPDELKEQVPYVKQILKASNINIFSKEGYEADDILGTISNKFSNKNLEAVILSGDKDMLQLATDNIKIRLVKTIKSDSNTYEYVDLYVNWFFNESINEFYVSFEKGFYRVFDKKLSKILSPQELELIICGTQKLDFNELKKSVKYEDYNEDSITVKYFWQIVMEFNEEEKKKFLFFVTGCDRAPIDGLGSLPFAISRNANVNEFPSAHTCFNNLILPDYKNKDLMKKKIQIAINYSEGFGLA